MLLEAVDLLKSQPRPRERAWAQHMGAALSAIANTMRNCGRFDEAAAALEECMEVQRVGRYNKDANPGIRLAKIYVQKGRFQEAIEVAKVVEKILDATEPMPGVGSLRLTTPQGARAMLYAALASAYEGLGREWECLQYHQQALDMMARYDSISPDVATCLDRNARRLCAQGRWAQAEAQLDDVPVTCYRNIVQQTGVKHLNSLRMLIPILRRLVVIKRHLGKEAEARALELELDGTEALMEQQSTTALEELRERMRAEREAGGAAGAIGAPPAEQQQQQQPKKGKKKLTRKQQKRKAAQRRKAEKQQAAAGGGEKEGEEEEADGAEMEEMAAAAAKLSLETKGAAGATEQPEEEEAEEEPEEEGEEEEEADVCAICLDEEDRPVGGKEGVTLLACSHAFHTRCLEQWKDYCLEKGIAYTCAMCRQFVTLAASPS
jgi:hypothetical protein